MIKRYDLESTVEYIAIDKNGKWRKDPKTGKAVVENTTHTYTNLEATSNQDAIKKFEGMIQKNCGSRFVSIKTKVVKVKA